MSETPVVLPTKEIALLLDNHGIETTWKSLILTLAVNSFDSTKSEVLRNTNEYRNVVLLEKNPLHGLSIGRISVLYEFSLAHVNRESRKDSGQYFTPDDVASVLAQQSDAFGEGVWLDPASGIGNLSYWLAERQPNPEQFVKDNLILVDRDPLALLIARSLFFLLFHKEDDNLFEEMGKNFFARDFLADAPLPKHDYAILNPPYVAVPADERFKTFAARDVYAYFLERIIDTSEGFISITPQSFTNSGKFHVLRRMLISKYKSLSIYSFDNMPDSIFKGIKFGSTNTNMANSTRAAIIVARKEDDKGHRITPMIRWVTAERQTMLDTIDDHLNDTPLSEAIFPKNYRTLTGLYKQVLDEKWEPLGAYLSKKKTAHRLIVPSTPRYFISAVKRDLQRSSFKELYFADEETLNKFYPLINSSLTYWWWRVNDGGMTVAFDTLSTLPVPPSLKLLPQLVTKLEASEQVNLVSKTNAGKENENVKHPRDLVVEVNETLFGVETTKHLMRIHNNSDVLTPEEIKLFRSTLH